MTPPTEAPEPQAPIQVWAGCTLSRYLRLLARNMFHVEHGYRGLALRNLLASAATSVLGLCQRMRHGRGIARTEIKEPPLFVLGHWRSGTTYLHDLLARDPRHTYPTAYECFMPHHFLLSEEFVKRRFPIETHRQQDEVEWNWDTPQEDEFALTLLGQPSPYLTALFPNRGPQDADYIDLEGIAPERLTAWKNTLLHLARTLMYKKPGRLLLKSPTHTGRIKVINEVFPEARFLHIVRNPYPVVHSTLHTFRLIYSSMALQTPTFAGLEEMVLSTYERMFRRLEEGRQIVGPERFHEVRYEDLTQDPIGRLREMYERLSLGSFEEVRPRVETYLAGLKHYHVGHHELTPELRAAIAQRCAAVFQRYRYTTD